MFRLMFSSGIVKLTSGCPTWWKLNALNYHYESQVLIFLLIVIKLFSKSHKISTVIRKKSIKMFIFNLSMLNININYSKSFFNNNVSTNRFYQAIKFSIISKCIRNTSLSILFNFDFHQITNFKKLKSVNL